MGLRVLLRAICRPTNPDRALQGSDKNHRVAEMLFEELMEHSDLDEEAVFSAAKELADPRAVEEFLDAACGTKQEMRRRIERLLTLTAPAQDFFQHHAAPSVDAAEVCNVKAAISTGPAQPEDGPLPRLGDYQLLEEIARGGMGVVYKAHQVSLDRLVAVKMLRFGSLAGKDSIKRFRVEASAAARLRHPNIVAVHEVGVNDNQQFLVMDYIPGQTLAKLSAGQPLVPAQAATFVKTIAEAIHFAHERGVLHRDLKPSNVLIDPNDQPYVTDFGLAKRLDAGFDLTLSGEVLGSPSYMPPEQASGKRGQVGRYSDVYSLGAILFLLLTGRPPFVAESASDTIQLVLEREPITPRTLVMGIPRDLETICLKCLRKESGKRYATAQELADELGRFLNHKPILARRATRFEKAWRWFRRRPALASFGAATAVLALAVVVGSPIAVYRINKARALAVRNESEARHNLYVANIDFAQQAWEQNNMGLVHQLLDETAADPNRGFEWFYWQRQTHRALMTLRGHRASINSAAFSPNGQRIITASDDGTAIVWEVATGRKCLTLTGHTGLIRHAAFSADGKWIVTGSADHTARVWEAARDSNFLTLTGHCDTVEDAAFSPDGRRVVTGSGDHTAKVWDVASGVLEQTLKGHSDGVMAVAFSPNGQRIVTGSADHTAKIWEAARGRELVTLTGHSRPIMSVAFSPEGQRIVTAGENETGRVWDASSGEELLRLKGQVYRAVFSPDGQRLATAGGTYETATVWGAADGEELFSLKGHLYWIHSVAFSPDGQRIVTGCRDGTAMIWEAAPYQESLRLKGSGAAFSPDRLRIVTRNGNIARVWDARTGREELQLSGHKSWIRSVCYSSDGGRILTGSADETARVWDAHTGQELLTLRAHTTQGLAAVFSPDGHRIVTDSRDQPARVWDAATGKLLFILGGDNAGVFSLGISPDGRRIITAYSDGMVRVWDSASGKGLFHFKAHNDGITSLAFSPDGQRLVTAGVGDRTSKVWDATSGKELQTLNGLGFFTWCVAFSPDGRRIATGSGDAATRVWDVISGKMLLTLKGQSGRIFSVAFSPDGRRIASGSQDETVRVWEIATARQVAAWQEEEKAQ